MGREHGRAGRHNHRACWRVVRAGGDGGAAFKRGSRRDHPGLDGRDMGGGDSVEAYDVDGSGQFPLCLAVDGPTLISGSAASGDAGEEVQF